MHRPLPYPALVASHAGIWIATPEGETLSLARGEAIARVADTPTILLNAPLTATRLGYGELSGLDLLELFAFVYPARFAVPTAAGFAHVLGLESPARPEEEAAFLLRAAEALLSVLEGDFREKDGAWSSAQALARLRWPWAPLILDRLERPPYPERWLFSVLPEWEDMPPRPRPRPISLSGDAVEERLDQLIGGGEGRTSQREYARHIAESFAPRIAKDRPHMTLAEAGTGIGKTLGYLAPASLWSEQADGAVWLSTYTKALQRQLDRETERLYPNPADKRERTVIRKGRENYLCLLNLEDAIQGGFQNRAAIFAQLVARWARYTRDGDMVGGDFPGWLPTLFRRSGLTALTDRRGECVYAGCPHYRRCFIERATRASAHADLVIANHALVMINAARAGDEGQAPERIVFDEGHHLFDAADATFAVALSGAEAVELRRWLTGPEGRARGRRRGLAARLSDVGSYDEGGGRAIEDALQAAKALPGEGWLARVVEDIPLGAIETLLARVRLQVLARARAVEAGYGVETELADPDPALVEAAGTAASALEELASPLARLAARLVAVLEEPPDWLDSSARARVDGALAGLRRRGETLRAWISLLARFGGPADPDFVDWLAVERIEGREIDICIHRRWLDPTRPLAEVVLKPAHGVVLTSATLRGGDDWSNADARAGIAHLDIEPGRFVAESPFDYAAQAEVLVVTDLKRGDLPALAGAYARLIEAAGGGTLGLFTAIQRLRAVHARIADNLARAGLPLYAQHVDPIDTGTLVDIFRDDHRASLLGTDALRDGVDVPGHSLRLVVMEGVPWPRPTVLHAARRAIWGGSTYDDRVVRGRLAQAFGRLIRRADDRGMFVMLSAATPSRLLNAFPPGTPVTRLPLADAIDRVRQKLSTLQPIGHQGVKEEDKA